MANEIQVTIPPDESEESMKVYRGIVSDLLEIGSDSIVKNESSQHAAVIIEEMIAHARQSFVAIADKFDTSVWSDRVVSALADAKKRGVDIRLLVVNEADAKVAEWNDIVRALVKQISIEDKKVQRNTLNFAVMDKKAVRIENDKSEYHAAFCANNAEIAKVATAQFDRLEKRAKPLYAA